MIDRSFSGSRVLVLAPHTDDGELGCGGTISRMISEGAIIFYSAFSSCKESVPDGFPDNILEIEMKAAMGVFGIPEEHVVLHNYSVRRFGETRQSILDDMIKLRSIVNPDIVFMPSIGDVHQDHHIIAEEAIRAFKNRTLFGYELPWNNLSFRNQAFVSLNKQDIEKKICALECYESQRNRAYTSSEFTLGQARFHGVQSGCEYAEVFEVLRLMI